MRIMVAGCGRLATQVHLPNLARMARVEVVALVDPSEESLAAAKVHASDAACHRSLEDALEQVQSDAVLIATPSDMHASMALMALDAGRSVYLEKPIATDLESAHRLVKHPNARHGIMVGFNYRFHPLVREMRNHVRAGTFGEVVSVRTIFSSPGSDDPGWRGSRKSGGGALMDLATHQVDLVRHLTGREVIAVSASLGSRHSQHDTASLLLHLDGGATAHCIAMNGCAETARTEVMGESGGANFEHYRSNRLDMIGQRVGGLSERLKSAVGEAIAFRHRIERLRHPWNEPSFLVSLQAFERALRSGRKPKPGIIDGIRSLEVLLAAEESASSGRRVSIESEIGS